MALAIETFNNRTGGNAFFKAVGHPIAAEKLVALVRELAGAGPVALYDQQGFLEPFAALYDLTGLEIAGVYVQDLSQLGHGILGMTTQPVTDLPASGAKAVLVLAFDSGRAIQHIRHLVPAGARVVSLDDARLPDDMLADRRRYLVPLNFATNHAFLRDADGRHSRVVTANYWAGYGAKGARLWLRLFDEAGRTLATWEEPLPDGTATIVVDSAEVRARFGLGEFAGSLFMHVLGAAGHDVVKYALDTYGDEPGELSCTHDANAWPADLYAGLPAPREGERVVLWLQNAHARPIPAGEIGLNLMGRPEIARLDREIPAFGTLGLDVASLLPGARWPQQIEVQAGKYVVRPRYEVIGARRSRIAHVNVERVDLSPDPGIPDIANLLGKGYLLPAPVLPVDRWRSVALPTPMATGQRKLPIAIAVYDADGAEAAVRPLGLLDRADSVAVEVDDLLNGSRLPSGYGHMEILYDFSAGGREEADGWLHGLFRYEDRETGHGADTSFGAHVFNTVLTYRNEPQSYAGPAPGLSTRLFLRVGRAPLDTICHLVYPASTPWHAGSETELVLTAADGRAVATERLAIPCGGSRFWRVSEVFDRRARETAGADAYVVVRDATCRLFGYHGLLRDGVAFSLDHMFGF